MGLFDKKYCDICGDKIGLLGNKKLEDGNLCKNCAKKLSPWFEGRRHATLDEVKKQLKYREENKNEVRSFRITREFVGDSYHVFIDDNQRKFAIAYNMDEETNPDIVSLDQVKSCRLNIDTREEEEYYKDKDGENRSYYPRRYKYYYNYSMKIAVDSPWFDDMDFNLNNLSIREHERGRMMEMERLGADITAALTANPAPQGYGAPAYGGAPVYAAGCGAPMGTVPQPCPTPVRAAAPAPEGQWKCSCGAMNSGKFCANCGAPRPAAGPRVIRCDKCGWVNEDPNNVPKFCPMCGDPINGADMQ